MNKLHVSLATLAAAGTLTLTTIAPASADSAASTRNIILGAAAIAGLAIEANVANKNAQAHRLSGYLPDGSAVYADGHVVGRDGGTYYPGNDGRSISCNNGACTTYANGNGAYNTGYNNGGYNNGGYNNGYNNGGYNNGGYNNGSYNNGSYNNGGYNNGYDASAAQRRAGDNDGRSRDRGWNGAGRDGNGAHPNVRDDRGNR